MHSKGSYSRETPNLGQIRCFLEPCDLEIWRMTLKNNRVPLLSIIKPYAWFHCHMWIQTGVTVRKHFSWVVTSVTLTFDLWPWTFTWTSLLSLAITPENFVMIRWWEHSQKGVTDRQTDRQSDRKYHSLSCLVAAKNRFYDKQGKSEWLMAVTILEILFKSDTKLLAMTCISFWHVQNLHLKGETSSMSLSNHMA